MSHFYGTLTSNRKPKTKRGFKSTGLKVELQSVDADNSAAARLIVEIVAAGH